MLYCRYRGVAYGKVSPSRFRCLVIVPPHARPVYRALTTLKKLCSPKESWAQSKLTHLDLVRLERLGEPFEVRRVPQGKAPVGRRVLLHRAVVLLLLLI